MIGNTDDRKKNVEKNPQYKELGGWLIFPALGLITSVLYSAPFARLINAVLLVYVLFVGYLFFKRDSRLPKQFIVLVLISLILAMFDMALSGFDTSAVGRFAINIVIAVIWIPYMMRSKRVRGTFVVDNLEKYRQNRHL